MYIDSLIGPDTVNTIPPATYAAFKDHGQPRSTLSEGLDDAERQISLLNNFGVDLEVVTKRLEDEGVQLFAKSFTTLLDAISTKTELLRSDRRAAG
jgi:transaldolase